MPLSSNISIKIPLPINKEYLTRRTVVDTTSVGLDFLTNFHVNTMFGS